MTEFVRDLIVAKLAEIRDANPAIADRIRLAKDGSSIAEFAEPREGGKGVMLYSSMIGLDDNIVDTLERHPDGRVTGPAVDPVLYEGTPDPPRSEPRFKAGDRVRAAWRPMAGGQPFEGNVVDVRSFRSVDRSWRHRVLAADGSGLPTGIVEADEVMFEPA